MVKRAVRYVKNFDLNLWILSLGWFVSAMGFAVSIPFISIYFHAELGMSMLDIGLFFSIMAIVRAAFQAIGGEIADRMERRYLLIHSQWIRSIAFGLMAVSIYMDLGFWAIAVSFFINSIFGSIMQPVANAMVSDILPKEKRLDGYAITRSAGNLGWAVGPAIGGFLAVFSYGFLFVVSGIVILISSFVFWRFLKSPPTTIINQRFKFKDLAAIKDDKFLAWHCILIFSLYLVVAQLIAPFSVYAVEMVKISEHQLGVLYTLNGLLVVALQIPLTKLISKWRFTMQLAMGSFIYVIGYGMVGFFSSFYFFIIAMTVVTFGEMAMSPPSLALTSKLAPEGRMGRYMGIFGFFVALGWSFGPLYGGAILDGFGDHHLTAWLLISSLAFVSGAGYLYFTRILPHEFNYKD